MKYQTIHILGAGVAGLSAAYFAKKKFPKCKVFIYESKDYAGGRCYSYFDKKLELEIDNATHVILGANSNSAKFYNSKDFHKKCGFYDILQKRLSFFWPKYLPHIFLSIFNTGFKEVPFKSLLKTSTALFPFTSNKTKINFSKGNLSKDLIEPLSKHADQIYYKSKLINIVSLANKVTKLAFSDKEVEVSENDLIISTLDPHNYQRIFGGVKFDYNRIINIFYRTSVALTLPKCQPFLGVINASYDWIFTSEDCLGVTISDAKKLEYSQEELARMIWVDICKIRGVQAAFLPPFRVLDYKQATISQNQENNAKRPTSAKTQFDNLLIAGDWTYKNFPCCIEGAILSAKRAVKLLK